MKRGFEQTGFPPDYGAAGLAKRRAGPTVIPASAAPGANQRMGMKMLFTHAEALAIIGQDSTALKSLEDLTGTLVRVSAEGLWYPGTKLRQLTILGSNCEMVLNAVLLAISQLAATTGCVTGGEADVEPDGARLRIIVPHEVGAGLHEECIEQLRLPRGVHLRVLPVVIPPGEVTDLSEQVVCISGSLKTVQTALQSLAQLVAVSASKPWFSRWAGYSHCGMIVPGLVLIESAPEAPPETEQWNSWGGSNEHGPGGSFVPGELSAPWGPPDMLALENEGAPPSGTIAVKLLLLPEEVAVIRGGNGAKANEIQHRTGTELRFSVEGDTYPGTSLEEMRILGPTAASTARASGDLLAVIADAHGTLGSGGPALEPGAAHARMVIPAKATSAVIGPGGQVVARIRSQTQLHVHVETTTIPLNGSTELSEQVVSFDGPLDGIHPAINMIAEILEQFMPEPWFAVWAGSSNSGYVIPGLTLFQDVKGKAKGKGKIKGKEGWPSGPGGLTVKILVAPHEASCVLGRGGAAVREIGQATGTRMSLSNRDQFYPGTQLQELVIKGSTHESVLNAAMHTLERITELSGAVSGGEGKIEPGGCRLKVVVPSHCASAIIGPGGSFVKSMRERSSMHVHVEETTVPPGPPNELTDQVVSLSGPLEGARAALAMLAEAVGRYTSEPWFEAWAANSHCGIIVPGLNLFADKGKGKGKPKGHEYIEEPVALYVDGKGKCKGGKPKGKFPFKGEDPWARPPPQHVPVPVPAPCAGKGPPGPPGPPEQRPVGSGGGGCPAGATGMALKVLISQEEVDVLTTDPSTMAEIQQGTGTSGVLSDKTYPGTSLQELAIQGPTPDAVLEAVLLILRKVVEVVGAVRCGEVGVPPGDARVKLVVPTRAAAAIIGPGGQNVKQLKVQAGLHVHVDTNSIPCNYAISEQGVCIAGPMANIQAALNQVVTSVVNCCYEPWFEAWSTHSNAGKHMPGLVLFEAKGKGGKGYGAGPPGPCGGGGPPAPGGGWGGHGPPHGGGGPWGPVGGGPPPPVGSWSSTGGGGPPSHHSPWAGGPGRSGHSSWAPPVGWGGKGGGF